MYEETIESTSSKALYIPSLKENAQLESLKAGDVKRIIEEVLEPK